MSSQLELADCQGGSPGDFAVYQNCTEVDTCTPGGRDTTFDYLQDYCEDYLKGEFVCIETDSSNAEVLISLQEYLF